MAASGYTPISLYYSTTTTQVPVNTNLVNGELAINITDGKLYYKDNAGVVQLLASKAGASGDVVGPSSATDNALARFDLTTGKIIQNSGVIVDDSNNVTGVAALTASGNVTLSGGTTNGVAYLNGSKVLTTDSALTFDGANLATGRLLSGRYTSDANGWGIQNYATNAYGSGIQLVYGGAGAAAMWVPAANSLAFGADSGAGTTEQMRLTSTGLSIGYSGGVCKLFVYDASAVETRIQSAGSATAQLTLRNSDRSWSWTNQSGGTLLLYDNTRGASVLAADSSGNVGIGTSSPSYKLDVNGQVNASSAGISSAGLLMMASDGTSNYLKTGATLYFQSGSTTLAQLNSSGDLGLGVTPSAWYAGWKAFEGSGFGLVSNGASSFYLTNNAYVNVSSGGWTYRATSSATRYDQNSGQHIFYTAPSGTAGNAISFTQAMRIDSSGNLQVSNLAGTGNRAVYSTSTGILTNSSSDRSLKENDTPISQGLNAVLAMRPISFEWVDKEKMGSRREIGFIAQEMREIVPEVVGSNSDETLSIDYPKLVAVMAKAIQELTARIAALEAK